MAEQNLSLQNATRFSQFYESCHLVVFRYIYGMTGGPIQEVEDLTAETFFRAWNKRSQFQGSQRAAVGWLLTIARNLVFDAHRRRKTHPEEELEENWDDHFFFTQPNPEANIEEHEQFRILWQLIQGLSHELREILILRYVLGWQVKEIARWTNSNENAISVSLYRAIKKIQQNWPGE